MAATLAARSQYTAPRPQPAPAPAPRVQPTMTQAARTRQSIYGMATFPQAGAFDPSSSYAQQANYDMTQAQRCADCNGDCRNSMCSGCGVCPAQDTQTYFYPFQTNLNAYHDAFLGNEMALSGLVIHPAPKFWSSKAMQQAMTRSKIKKDEDDDEDEDDDDDDEELEAKQKREKIQAGKIQAEKVNVIQMKDKKSKISNKEDLMRLKIMKRSHAKQTRHHSHPSKHHWHGRRHHSKRHTTHRHHSKVKRHLSHAQRHHGKAHKKSMRVKRKVKARSKRASTAVKPLSASTKSPSVRLQRQKRFDDLFEDMQDTAPEGEAEMNVIYREPYENDWTVFY